MTSSCAKNRLFAAEPLENRIAPAFNGVINLADLNGSDGFSLSGTDHIGTSTSDAGDVNGDGVEDVIIGSNGASYVVFGNASGFAANLDLATLDGKNGFKLSGAATSVSSAGDFNADGFDDLIIGNGPLDAGYVVFGKASGFAASIELTALNGANGFQLRGGAHEDVGKSVSGAGDVNNDGFDDVIIGAPHFHALDSPEFADGAAYLVFGKASGFGATFDLWAVDGVNGFRVSHVSNGQRGGTSVSGAGDINGDGFGDLIIGTLPTLVADPRHPNYVSFVVFGKASGFAADLRLSNLDGTDGFTFAGGGHSVSEAGDVNGDGFGDLIVGNPSDGVPFGPTPGAGFVVFGKASGFTAFSLENLDGSNGFKLSGAADGDRAGVSVSRAGDFNADGFDDLIVGASGAPNGESFGASYVVFGKASGFAANLELGTEGLKLTGVTAFDFAGVSVSAAGDLNSDGFDDVIIGAPGIDAPEDGHSYVVFGTPQLSISEDGKQATFTDVDGDEVTIRITNGSLTNNQLRLVASGKGAQLELLSLLGSEDFAASNLTIKAKTPAGGSGDGKVNVGSINARGVDLGIVKIGGDLGQIDANRLTSLKVESIGTFGLTTQSGSDASLHSDITGSLGELIVKSGGIQDATVAVLGKIGAINITGNVDGALITALGKLNPSNASKAQAIKGVSIAGNLTDSRILAGYDLAGLAMNPDVRIGSVIVKGDWSGSSVVAGIADTTNDGFGRNDQLIAGGNTIVSRIASITIKGTAIGSSGGDYFGITAERIGKAKIGGVALPLTSDKDSLALDLTNNDFRLVEV